MTREYILKSMLSTASSEVADFGEAMFHNGIENPINGAMQLVSHVSLTHLPELHLVDGEQVSQSIGGKLGAIVGTAADFYGLTLATGGLGGAGYLGSAARMGTVGAAYTGIFQPSDPNSKNFYADRFTSASVSGITFAGMGAAAAALDAVGIFAAPASRSLLGSTTYGAISGAAGGTVYSEANAIFKQGRVLPKFTDFISDFASYTAFGAALGGIGYGVNRLMNPSPQVITDENETVANNKTTVRQWHRFRFLPHAEEEVDAKVTEVIRDNLDSVVAVVPYKSNGGSKQFLHEMGTGFFVDDQGTIATAQHVIPEGADGTLVIRQNGEVRMADVLKTTNKYDLALLRINPDSPILRENSVVSPRAPANETFPAVHLAQDPTLSHGDSVVAIGFPSGHISASPGKFDRLGMAPEISASSNGGLRNTLSGILGEQFSNLNIGPGNSGSPLFRTSDGATVGVVTKLYSGMISPQQSASIPVNFLKELIGNR